MREVGADTGEPLVFTEEFMGALARRNMRLPETAREPGYNLATIPGWAGVRQQIEGWVASLPDDKRCQVVRNLQSKDGLMATYHELVVGEWLERCGHAPEYERKLESRLTPDWFVAPTDRLPGFVVEVLTASVSEERSSQEKLATELRGRLERMAGDEVVAIRPGNSPLTSERVRSATVAVEQWLAGGPAVGDRLDVAGVSFELRRRRAVGEGVRCLLSLPASPVDTRGLAHNIRLKVKKYQDAAKVRELPLVLAVVPEFYTGIEFDDVQCLLEDADWIHPILTAVIVFAGGPVNWGVRALHHPGPLYRLPADALSEKSQDSVNGDAIDQSTA